jgi:hypothetical protein
MHSFAFGAITERAYRSTQTVADTDGSAKNPNGDNFPSEFDTSACRKRGSGTKIVLRVDRGD